MLTRDLIISRTRTEQIHILKKFNIWGRNLKELSILSEMPQLEVLALPVNSISSLKYFSCLPKLKELYLRKNFIADFKELRHLESLKHLEVLAFSENPISEAPLYREIVISRLPKLKNLDGVEINEQERQKSTAISLNRVQSLEQGMVDYSTPHVETNIKSPSEVEWSQKSLIVPSHCEFPEEIRSASVLFKPGASADDGNFLISRPLPGAFLETTALAEVPVMEPPARSPAVWKARSQKSGNFLPSPSDKLPGVASRHMTSNSQLHTLSSKRNLRPTPLQKQEPSTAHEDQETRKEKVVLQSVLALTSLLDLEELTVLNHECLRRIQSLR